MDERVRARLRDRRVAVVGAFALLALASTAWWTINADDRRVDSACGSWLAQRAELRSALDETDEAAERARSARTDVRDEFNDIDRVRGSLARWKQVSPGIIGSLDGTTRSSGEDLEDNLTFFLGQVDEQVDFLTAAIDGGDVRTVGPEVSESAATFQVVDDLCLTAARSG